MAMGQRDSVVATRYATRVRWFLGEKEFLADMDDPWQLAQTIMRASASSTDDRTARTKRASDFSWEKVSRDVPRILLIELISNSALRIDPILFVRLEPSQATCGTMQRFESFFSSLKIERTARKTYRTRDQAKVDVFDYIECLL